MDKFKDIPGWIIFFACIFAWPFGLILLVLKYYSKTTVTYRKENESAKIINENNSCFRKLNKLKGKRKTFKILAIIAFIFSSVFFVALISDFVTNNLENISGGIIVNVFDFIVLFPIFITYFKTNNLVKKIESYQNLIIIRDIYDTNKLATYFNCSRTEVLDFITYMIREGYLELDIENDKLIKPKEYVDPAQVFSIICQTCGATNKYIKGKNNKCEYCGNVLNLNKIYS